MQHGCSSTYWLSCELQLYLQGVGREVRWILLTLKNQQNSSKRPALRNQPLSSFRKDLPWTFLVSEDALRKLTHPVWPCPHIGRWVLWCNQQFQTSEGPGRRGCWNQFLLLPSQLLMFSSSKTYRGWCATTSHPDVQLATRSS